MQPCAVVAEPETRCGDVVDVGKLIEALAATIRLRLTEIDLCGGWLLRLNGVIDDPIVWRTGRVIGRAPRRWASRLQ
jgi:hypothetical protein